MTSMITGMTSRRPIHMIRMKRSFPESAISGETNPVDMPLLHIAETTSKITLLESNDVGCRCITSIVATKMIKNRA